jgi:acetyl-CoA carboxylase carboxyl transferase subunit beta
MAWRDLFRPKVNVRTDGVFTKCEGCTATVRHKDVDDNLSVCPECGYHFRVGAKRRIEITVDPKSFKPLFEDVLPADPLQFRAAKSYAERLAACQKLSGATEAISVGTAKIEGRDVVFGVTDCNFMMGSMGSVVGERIARGAELALESRVPFVIVSGSGGGARMDEGALSLMQMAKTSAAIGKLHRAGVAYLVVVTNPTYGGVSASFASLGDVIVAEPRAQMGFTGPRVIKQTMKVDLPPGFQESEFLRDHGQIDVVVERKMIRPTLVRLIDYLDASRAVPGTAQSARKKRKKKATSVAAAVPKVDESSPEAPDEGAVD